MHNRLQKARLAAGLKQKEVAEKLGIAAATLSQYESGTRKPDAETMFVLADLYKCSARWLVTGKNEPNVNSAKTVRYNNRNYLVIPFVNHIYFNDNTNEIEYHTFGLTAAETTIDFYSHFNDHEPGKLVWTLFNGDSCLIAYGILPSSYLLVSIQSKVPDGDIALLYIGDKMVCRKIYQSNDNMILVVADPTIKDEIVPLSEVTMIGKVLAVSNPIG